MQDRRQLILRHMMQDHLVLEDGFEIDQCMVRLTILGAPGDLGWRGEVWEVADADRMCTKITGVTIS